MLEIFQKIGEAFDAGGVFIYPIHVTFVIAIAVAAERIYWLYVKSSMNVEAFIAQIKPAIERKDLQSAVQFCDSIQAPAARLAKTVIVRGLAQGSRSDIEATIETALARESHPIERRTAYLSMLANLATLIGLLGTISGLITAFAAAATLDPTDRAQKLSEGIAEAMNCTAYGLLVAIFSLVCFAFLQGKTQSLIDELKETAFEIRSSLPFDESSKKGAA
jgi:biopolymer transport protein ExbB/TolQ